MSKDTKFSIHDWQAKRRLTEAGMDTPGGNPDYFYDKDSIFGKLKDDPNFIKKLNTKNAKKDVSESLNPEVSRSVDKFIRTMADKYDYSMQDAVYAIMAALKQRNYDGLGEHHNDEDFPGKDLSSWDLLDKLKAGNKELYNKVEDFMKSMKEMNVTSPNVSATGGTGMGHFGDATKKKRK